MRARSFHSVIVMVRPGEDERVAINVWFVYLYVCVLERESESEREMESKINRQSETVGLIPSLLLDGMYSVCGSECVYACWNIMFILPVFCVHVCSSLSLKRCNLMYIQCMFLDVHA